MKKQLLSLALGLTISVASFGQDFTQTADNTGLTYLGDVGTQTGLTWTFWGPDCAFSGNDNGGGGFDESPVNELKLGWGQSGNGYMYNIMTLTNPLDLSAVANQKLQVTLRNLDGSNAAYPLTYILRFEDGSGTSLLDNPTMNVTGTNQTFNIDLSSHIATGQNLSSVKAIIIIYSSCPSGTVVSAAQLYMSNLKVGSVLVTGISKASDVIAQSKVYPNPASGTATLSLDLKSNSNVKVVLNDLVGKEMKVIAEGNYTNINQNFSVADLNKGMYVVTYIVNGSAVKTESLVVR